MNRASLWKWSNTKRSSRFFRAARLQALGFVSAKWQERTADAAFYSRDYREALAWYEAASGVEGACYCNYLKMADIFHIQGDAVNQRKYREMIYARFERVDCNDVNCKA